MVVKLADFGLSGCLKTQGQKRKTICGTPNYIAPEVLKNQGHDYLVDNWAVGVIVYTFLFGKPPFEEKEVENTLKNIKQNRFSFPQSCQISKEAKDFIEKTLIPNPEQRLTLDQMIQHPFLQSKDYIIPITMPTCTLALPPPNSYLRKLKQIESDVPYSKKQEIQDEFEINGYLQRSNNFMSQQRKDGLNPKTSVSPHMRHEQQETHKQLERYKSSEQYFKAQNFVSTNHQQSEKLLHQISLESQSNSKNVNKTPLSQKINSIEEYNLSPLCRSQFSQRNTTQKEAPLTQRGIADSQKLETKKLSIQDSKESLQLSQSQNILKDIGKNQLTQNENINNYPIYSHTILQKNKNIYIFDYIDCCDQFGIAYFLNNGTVGILLNDSSVIQIFDNTFEHITSNSKDQSTQSRKKYQIDNIPSYEKRFYTLIESIKEYFLEKFKNLEEKIEESDFETDVYLKKYSVEKKAQFFRFSNKDLQVQFLDKSEIIMGQKSKRLYYKDKKGQYSLFSIKDRVDLPAEVHKRFNFIKEIFTSKSQEPKSSENSNNLAKAPSASSIQNYNSYNKPDKIEEAPIKTNEPNLTSRAQFFPQARQVSPFGCTTSNQTNQNTTSSTNNSVSTQQFTPFYTSMNHKNYPIVSKLSPSYSQNKMLIENYQSPPLNPLLCSMPIQSSQFNLLQ